MAKLTAPLLSLGASGQIAKTMVAATWKGIPYMRQFVIPANPKTAAQVAQRASFTASVNAWRSYLTDATVRAAWRVFAGVQPSAQSAFNAAVAQLSQVLAADPDASFVTALSVTAQIAEFTVKNMDDGATGDETGDFLIWKGTTSSNLQYLETKSIVTGKITTSALGDAGEVVFLAVLKAGTRGGVAYNFNRGGIYQVTL